MQLRVENMLSFSILSTYQLILRGLRHTFLQLFLIQQVCKCRSFNILNHRCQTAAKCLHLRYYIHYSGIRKWWNVFFIFSAFCMGNKVILVHMNFWCTDIIHFIIPLTIFVVFAIYLYLIKNASLHDNHTIYWLFV